MPLKGLDTKTNTYIYSYSQSEQTWEALREHANAGHLVMPCCGNNAVLKTSMLGTRFFSHHRRGDCSSASETQEHLFLKSVIAQAAEKIPNVIVEVEKEGSSSYGKKWRADVHIEVEGKKYAFEIQWSNQTVKITQERSKIYLDSGVQPIWFFRRTTSPPSSLAPVFRIQHKADQFYFIDGQYEKQPKKIDYIENGISINDLVFRVLRGGLRLNPTRKVEHKTMRFLGDIQQCKRCRIPLANIEYVEILAEGYTENTLPGEWLLEGRKKVLQAATDIITAENNCNTIICNSPCPACQTELPLTYIENYWDLFELGNFKFKSNRPEYIFKHGWYLAPIQYKRTPLGTSIKTISLP